MDSEESSWAGVIFARVVGAAFALIAVGIVLVPQQLLGQDGIPFDTFGPAAAAEVRWASPWRHSQRGEHLRAPTYNPPPRGHAGTHVYRHAGM